MQREQTKFYEMKSERERMRLRWERLPHDNAEWKEKKKETAIRLGAPQLAYFFFIAHTHTRTQKCLAASFLLAELFISFSLPTAQLPLPPKKKKKKYELCA